MLRSATLGRVKTISQRELRNDNADIVRGVEAGESYVVTRRGVPVARLVPLDNEPDLRLDRPARKRPRYASRTRVKSAMRTDELVRELRGER